MDADFADETQMKPPVNALLKSSLSIFCSICVSSAKSASICVEPFDMLGGLAAKKTMEITKPLLSRG